MHSKLQSLSYFLIIIVVQSLSCVKSWQPHGLQHDRLPYPSPSPGACSNISVESVMPSNHFILWHLLLLPLSIFPSITVFSNESALHIRWPKYWNFSLNISPSNEHSGLISFTGCFSLQSKGLSRVFSNTAVQKHQFFGTQLSLCSNSYTHT